MTERDLAGFTGAGYDKGRPKHQQALWFAVQNLLFSKWWLPARFRPRILRAFGATVGEAVFIWHRVRVLWPWKLMVGDHCWIGEDVWLLNLEPITLVHDVCISQGAFLCTGSHDRRSATFEYDDAPITVRAGAWIAARAMVLRGVIVGTNALVPAGVVVHRDLAGGGIASPPGRTSAA